MVAYERVFETEFDRETKWLFTKWSLEGGGRLREVVARRELTVTNLLFLSVNKYQAEKKADIFKKPMYLCLKVEFAFYFTGESQLEKFVSRPDEPPRWPKTCPTGYARHLGAIEQDNCEINYCVKSHVFISQGFRPLKRFRFMDAPKIMNYSVPLLLVNQDAGQIWFKRSDSPQWVLATKRYRVSVDRF